MPCVAHLMLVMLRLTPFVAHLMLVMVLNMPEQCSFHDLLLHLPFMPKYAEKSPSRMDISLYFYKYVFRDDAKRKNSQVFGVRFEYLDRSKSEGSSGSLRS